MPLNKQQKAAVEYLNGPLLVLAGPGTGKTQLLSEKVAYILKNTDTNPENILCMTFTEAGATNMRERLKTVIGSEGLKVKINTYHAFGSDILAQYQAYSTDYDRRLDSPIDEITQYKIIKSLQSSLPVTDILQKDNIKDIISVISSAKSANLTAKDLATIATQNLEDSAVLSNAISPLLKNIVPRNFKASYEAAYYPIYQILQKYTDLKPILKNYEHTISILARELKDAIVEAESTEKIKPLSAWKDTNFEKDGKGNYRLKDRVANKKLESLAKIMAAYDTYLKDNGLYDYDDMIEEAVKVLKSDPGFKDTLKERYQFIMLDEFQDTNPSQFSIIKELTDYDNPLIMAVGDDDQAIYEFQGALSTNLTDFQKHYNAEVIALTENYRSTQEILDFSHEIIAQAPDRFADKELTAHKENPKNSEIKRYEFAASDAEYAFVAKSVHDLVKSGAKQSEIAVISYKTKYFLPLLPYLKSYPEINIAYEKRDNLFENEKIHQILTLSRYIYELATERNENTSILEILSYPFFDLPMLEVLKTLSAAHAAKKSVFDYLATNEHPAIKAVTDFIANLVQVSLTEPLEIFLDYLIGASELKGYKCPFLEYYSKNSESETFSLYESLAALRGKLNQHFGDKSLKLADLISMVDDYTEATMPLNSTSPYKDSDDAIQILSAHKSKGLEFEHVFIISADHAAWGKGKGNNDLLKLPKNLLQIRHTGTTDGEKLRILYVALTRAKKTLTITNSLRDFNGKSPARLEYFNEYEENGKVISPFLPEKYINTKYLVNELVATESIKNWLTPFIKPSNDMRAIYQDRVNNYKMSASSLTSFIDVVYAGPQEFFKNYILGAPREPETEALAFGNLIHKTFETITNQQISDEDAIKLFLSELDKRDIESSIKNKIREKGPADLMVSLQEFGNILRQGKAEVNFSPDKLVIAGVPVVGKIDHITIDDAKKTIEIYDFKTGGYHKEKWQSHATLYKYMLQLGFYKLLLNNSPTYHNYKVEKAHILFVTPDKDNFVYDKIYEYNDKDEKALLELMKAVYHQITTLSFLDDPELFIPTDNNKGLKDIQDFITLLLAKN